MTKELCACGECSKCRARYAKARTRARNKLRPTPRVICQCNECKNCKQRINRTKRLNDTLITDEDLERKLEEYFNKIKDTPQRALRYEIYFAR